MANEATKFRERWRKEGLWDKYFRPDASILDIGCGDDKIRPDARGWDIAAGDGNGQLLETIPDESFDIVFSSHFLEHVADPLEALLNQWRVLKPRGYLIFQIPDEDIYEQFIYPSIFNTDHKFTWTIHKDKTWSPAGKNIADLIRWLPGHKIISLRIIDTDYDYEVFTNSGIAIDQTDGIAEAAIEGIIQKHPLQVDPQGLLSTVLMCLKCKHLEYIIRGRNKENRLVGWCHNCGDASTEFNFTPNVPS